MKKGSGNGLKWLTALMLSPGMIFTAAYLLVWLSMNLYLDNSFKDDLRGPFTSETGVRYRLSIGSLRTGPDLNSLTLRQLELIPFDNGQNQRTNGAGFQVAELKVPCPDLCFFPFRPTLATISTRKIFLEILSRDGSMNGQSRPLPSYRGDLVYRLSQERQVGIP